MANPNKFTAKEVLNKVLLDSSGNAVSANSVTSQEALSMALDATNNRLNVALEGGTISGDVTISGDLTVNGSDTNANYDEIINGNLVLSSGSKLGIGTGDADPAQPLHIKSATPSILFEDTTNGYLGYVGDAQDFLTGDSPGADSFGIRSEGDIRLGTGVNNLRMTINSSGNVGIGTDSADGKLHSHSGSAGSVSASAGALEGVFENSGDAGITLLSPDASFTNVIFGSASDSIGAQLKWKHDNDLFRIGTANVGASLAFETANTAEAMRIDA